MLKIKTIIIERGAMQKDQTNEDIKVILNYLWRDEKKHYGEWDYPKDHIFRILKRLAKAIDYKYEYKFR